MSSKTKKTGDEKGFDWEEDTFSVIERLISQNGYWARPQLDSYNDFCGNIIPSLIKNHNPIRVGHPDHWDADLQQSRIIYEVEFNGQPYMSRPQLNEGSGSIQDLYPMEARHRNLSYSALMYLSVTHRILQWNGREYVVAQNPDTREPLEKHEARIPFKFPNMLHSEYCYFYNMEAESRRQYGECPFDQGGYFLVNGSEKVIISQERPVDNKVLCFKQKAGAKYDEEVEVRSTMDQRFFPVRNNKISLTQPKEGEADQYLRIFFPYLSKDIPLIIVFRALGVTTDEEIMQMILGSDVTEEELSQDQLASLSDMIQLILPSFDEQVALEIELSEEDAADRKKKKKVPKAKITTQQDAQMFIARHINNMNLEFLEKKIGTARPTDEQRAEARAQYVTDILRRDLLPHMGEDFRTKCIFLGYMTNILLKCKLGLRYYDVRDHYANKRCDMAGPLLKKLYQGSLGRLIKDIKKEVSKTLENKQLALYMGLRKVIQNCNMEAPIKKALSTGDWTTGKNAKLRSSTTQGIAQVLQRPSHLGYLSYLRRIQTPMEKAGNKITEPRKLNATQFGYVCPNETPEGQQVGIMKNLAMTASSTISSSSLSIKAALKKKIIPLDEMDLRQMYLFTKVFLNGEWLGCTMEPSKLYYMMKRFKRDGTFNPMIGIFRDFEHKEIHIRTDGGRYTRPLYVVEELPGRKWVPKIALEWEKAKGMNWKELVQHGYIEYIDPEECENCVIAMHPDHLIQNSKNKDEWYRYTHLELHPSMIHGVVAQMIPFCDHNVSPRNCFQSAMGKQAMGLSTTNFQTRMDTMSNILAYPMTPLVQTRTMKLTDLDRLPHGQQCIVAVMCYTGYNQEDSILMNKSFIEMGGFNSFYYKTYSDDENPHKSSTSESEQFGRPDPSHTEGIKHGEEAYRHLDDDGFAKLDSKVDVNDVIIGKTVKLSKEIKSYTGQQYTHTDISTQVKQGDDGYVDLRIPGPGMPRNLNSDNNPFAKIRIAQLRKPVIGDKFASRSAQKGTVGLILPEEDMPFTDTGMVPDIIMNPHAYPSRMTISQMYETVFGKAAALQAEIKDATPFTHFDDKTIGDALESFGFERNGQEIMYNGYTGEQFPVDIFIGPVYYQRLKHMVKDKVHARATGRVNNLTRQSVEGRARDGGLRMGEMERDVLIAHGMAAFTKESFMDRADKFPIYIGKESETMVVANPDKDLYMYNKEYLNQEEVDEAQIPYAMKLLIQEWICMGIDVRMRTESAV